MLILLTTPSPWQRAFVERVIGSIRRECLDPGIVFHENSLRRTLNSYFDYYHRSRTHLSLGKDCPEPRAIQPPEMGSVVRCHRGVDCITATNDGLREKALILVIIRIAASPVDARQSMSGFVCVHNVAHCTTIATIDTRDVSANSVRFSQAIAAQEEKRGRPPIASGESRDHGFLRA